MKMKKLVCLLSALLMMMCSSCSLRGNKLYDIDFKTYTSETLQIVTEKANYSVDDTVIRYSVTNVGETEECIAADDACFELHKLVDGEWKCVGTKTEHYWNDLALILNPGQGETREIPLDEYYHLPLDEGEYRIAIERLVSESFVIS